MPASSEPFCAPTRTLVRLPAGCAPPRELPVVPLHTVPLCTCLRCPTETLHLNRSEPCSSPLKLPLSVEPKCGGGLLLLRHITPLPRRDVVYFCSGAHNGGLHHARLIHRRDQFRDV